MTNNDAFNIINNEPSVEALKELLAYEALFEQIDTPSFERMKEVLNGKKPSHYLDNIDPKKLQKIEKNLLHLFRQGYSFLTKNDYSYPKRLLQLENAIEILYYSGNISLLKMPSIAIIGSRKASERGLKAAGFVSSRLSGDGYAVMSGLAEGIDRAAHSGAIKSGGTTIAVIGTPINEYYPKKNAFLQNVIKENHLLLSQIPIIRYKNMHWEVRRFFFPVRNKTMASLSDATIVVEASEKSGTRSQVAECARLGKKIVFLKSMFENKSVRWPEPYINNGACVAKTYNDIKKYLQQ